MGNNEERAMFPREKPVAALSWLCTVLATYAGYWWVMNIWPAWQACWLIPEGPGSWFPDIYAVLAASDLNATGFDPYGDNPLGVKHFYPRLWFELARLGLARVDAHWLGLLLGGLFLAMSLLWLRPRKYTDAAFATACLLAPPLTLGFQRANVDNLLYMLLIILAVVLTSRRDVARIGLGSMLVMVGTMLKFYPIFAAAAVWWNEAGRRRWCVVLMFAVMFCLYGVSLWEDYQRITGIVNLGKIGGHIYSFGANFAPGLRMVAWLGAVACLVAAWVGWRRLACRLGIRPSTSEPVGFMLGGCVLLGCFIIGNNFAYRLVFVLLMIPWLWRLRDNGDRVVRGVAVAALVLTLLLLWRDGLLAVFLRGLQQPQWRDIHHFLVSWHQQMLAAIQWMWCAIVMCLMVAMLKQIPVAKRTSSGRT